MLKTGIYINPEALFLGQVSAIVRDCNGNCLGYTDFVDIPADASKKEIERMKQVALDQAKRGEYIRYLS